MSARRVVLSVAALNARWGGPSRSVPALADALCELGIEAEIVTLKLSPRYGPEILPRRAAVRWVRCRTSRQLPTLWVRRFRAELTAAGRQAGTWLHDNGLWLPTNHAAAQVARLTQRPLLVCPRGMLSNWALGFRAWRKRLAWLVYARRDLAAARAFHVTSEQEAEEVRRLGFIQPVLIVPNGVELPRLRHRQRRPGEPRSVLFLSRIHPKKGLEYLIDAWARLRPKGWRVIVAGPAESSYLSALRRRIEQAGLQDAFTFPGPVEGDAKWELYRNADLFVLPSLSENFGLVVAEALASECPVITTRATPWSDLERAGCGWWIETGADALLEALQEALAMLDIARQEMGRRGRQWVARQYAWRAVAERLAGSLEWLERGGPTPDWVWPEQPRHASSPLWQPQTCAP